MLDHVYEITFLRKHWELTGPEFQENSKRIHPVAGHHARTINDRLIEHQGFVVCRPSKTYCLFVSGVGGPLLSNSRELPSLSSEARPKKSMLCEEVKRAARYESSYNPPA